MKEPKQMSVSAIENGTVIDHVPANNLFKVIQILGLDTIENQITWKKSYNKNFRCLF
jgi:aspartate carbamoyltransferase regulatory subunit